MDSNRQAMRKSKREIEQKQKQQICIISKIKKGKKKTKNKMTFSGLVKHVWIVWERKDVLYATLSTKKQAYN